MTRVLLDARMRHGGVGRYSRALVSGLKAHPEIETQVRSGAAPFTPWGRATTTMMARSWGADVIHGLHFELPYSRIPSVATIPDLIPLQHPDSMPSEARRVIFRRMLSRSVERADVIIVPSPTTAAALVEFGASEVKIRVIPLGVSEVFQPADAAEREEARDRFASGKRYVAAVAEDRPHKNLRAYVAIADRLTTPEVLFVLRGPQTVASTNVRLIDRLNDDDLRMFYAGAEVVVVPSLIEGFGLPAVEALACGTQVICGPGLGALPFLDDAATVVDVGNEDELAGATAEAIRRAPNDVVRAAGRKLGRELSLDDMVGRTIDVYDEMVRARR